MLCDEKQILTKRNKPKAKTKTKQYDSDAADDYVQGSKEACVLLLFEGFEFFATTCTEIKYIYRFYHAFHVQRGFVEGRVQSDWRNGPEEYTNPPFFIDHFRETYRVRKVFVCAEWYASSTAFLVVCAMLLSCSQKAEDDVLRNQTKSVIKAYQL